MIEKVLFWGQIFEIQFSMELYTLRSPKYENHNFSDGSVWPVFYQHNSKINYSREFKFNIYGFKVLTPTKTGFCETRPPPTPYGGRHGRQVFKRNSAPNYLTMTKLYMEQLDLNTKKLFSAIFEFSILRNGGSGENAKFRKI